MSVTVTEKILLKGRKRLTDEDVIVGRVGKDDGVAEQTGGVVYGGGGNCHTGEGNALICGPRRRGRSAGRATFRFRKVLDGRSCDKEDEDRVPQATLTRTYACSWRRGFFGYLATSIQSSVH